MCMVELKNLSHICVDTQEPLHPNPWSPRTVAKAAMARRRLAPPKAGKPLPQAWGRGQSPPRTRYGGEGERPVRIDERKTE
jgi:hypothetical protein